MARHLYIKKLLNSTFPGINDDQISNCTFVVSLCGVLALVSYWSKESQTTKKGKGPGLWDQKRAACDCLFDYLRLSTSASKMRIHIFCFVVVCTLLAQNAHSQQQCTLDSACGELSNILQRQDSLEKKVEEHSKILSGDDNGKNLSLIFILLSIQCIVSIQIESNLYNVFLLLLM